jgi:hypothetical protein
LDNPIVDTDIGRYDPRLSEALRLGKGAGAPYTKHKKKAKQQKNGYRRFGRFREGW